MIESLLVALILIAILCVIAGAIIKLVPGIPAPVPTVIWAIVAVVCLLILLQVFTGNGINFGNDLRIDLD